MLLAAKPTRSPASGLRRKDPQQDARHDDHPGNGQRGTGRLGFLAAVVMTLKPTKLDSSENQRLEESRQAAEGRGRVQAVRLGFRPSAAVEKTMVTARAATTSTPRIVTAVEALADISIPG